MEIEYEATFINIGKDEYREKLENCFFFGGRETALQHQATLPEITPRFAEIPVGMHPLAKTALAKGCSDFNSKAPAIFKTSSEEKLMTWGSPLVKVPVLSKII